MGTYIEPFDFRTLFLDYFLGSMELFIFAFIMVISYTCAKFGMSNRLYMMVLVIGLLLFAITFQLNEIYLLIVLISGLVAFNSIRRLIQ